jgi:hypothetical protein
MAVTRIRNNQITDNTIEYQKIKDFTLVGTKFNPNITFNSNISIIGNLSVTGNTYTVSSTNTFINDPLVIFNNGYTGTPSYDVGMLVNRDLQAVSPTNYGGLNSAWVWREADGAFESILTTETGSTQGSINRTAYANVIVGNTIIRTGGTNASVVEAVDTGSGALQVKGGASFTQNVQIGGTASVFGANTGQVAIDGNVSIAQITQLSSTRYGLMVTDTNNNGAFALRTGTAKGAEIHTFGGTNNDIYIQPDRLKSIWLPAANASVLADNNLNSSSANVGAIVVTGSGGIGIGGNLNIGTAASFESGQVYIQSSKANDVVIGKNQLKSGLSANVVALGAMQGTTSIGINATLVGAAAGPAATPANATYIGKSAGNLATGSDSTYLGHNAGSLVTTGQYNVIVGSYDGNVINTLSNQVVIADGAGAPRIRVDATGNVFVVSGVNSTTANTGAFVVQGGAGIGGNLHVGGALAFASDRGTLDATQTSLVLSGNTATATLGTNGVVIGQLIGQTGTFGSNATVIGYQTLNTTATAASITAVGARAGFTGPGLNTTLVGADAGLSLTSTGLQNQFFGYNSGSLVTSGDYNVIIGSHDGNTIAASNNNMLFADGQGNPRITIDDTGKTTIISTVESGSPSTGAFVVAGGMGIAANLYVGANLTVTGNLTVLGQTTTVNAQNITVNDAIIELHTFANLAPLSTNDTRDIGIRNHYYISNDRQSFFGFQNSTQNFVYIDAATETNGVVSGTYGNVQFGSAWLSNTTASSGQTVGALVVKGGIGAGALSYLHSTVTDNNVTASGLDAWIQFKPSGTGNVDIGPTATTGNIDNMFIGQTTPRSGTFTVLQATQTAYLNPTGTVQVQPTQLLTINPGGSLSTMDNVYIGNTTPRSAIFTAASVGNDLTLGSFLANSALFISPSGNVTVDQKNEAYNFQRTTANTFATVALSVGHTSQNNLLRQGTDTLNIRYQGDSYLENSAISANVLGQTPGWTVSTSRGTAVAPEVTQDGDFNGVYGAYAWTGGTPSYQEIGALRYVNQGTTAAASGIGGEAQLWTKRDNGASTLALRVDTNQISTFYGQVAVANSTVSTNTTTGALYVNGGISTSGNLNVGLGMRVNDLQVAGKDFYVRGGNDATLIWGHTAAAYNQVLVGNSAVQANLIQGAKLQINSTDSMLLPIGTSGQRPGLVGFSDIAGMIRYNSIANDIEYYNGTSWIAGQGSSITVVTDQQFNGDGSTVNYTLSRESTTNATVVTLNGVVQIPTLAYSVSVIDNVTLTFTEAPAVDDLIDIRTFATTSVVAGLSSQNGYVEVVTTNNGVTITGSTVSAGQFKVLIGVEGDWNATPTPISVSTSAVAIDTFDKGIYRSAKYQIQVTNGANYEVSEVLVVHDGTTAYRTQYGLISTSGTALGTVTALVVGSNIEVRYTGASAGNTVKVVTQRIAV